MIEKNIRTFQGEHTIEYTLEPKDFDYLSNEFNVFEDSLGINLISKKNPKLAILLRKHGIFYDRDVSSRGTMIATERIDIRVISILSRIGVQNWYQKYIPNTTDQLEKLIDEFKFKPFGTIKEENIVEYLQM